MKINNINIVTFGYNKKLNRKLVQKLESSPENKMSKPLLAINSSCNETEDALKILGKDYENNKILIDILTKYFNNAKAFLCAAADRMFPDLNYTELESETYDKELAKAARKEAKSDEELQNFYDFNIKDEYTWLRVAVDDLNDVMDDAQYFLGESIRGESSGHECEDSFISFNELSRTKNTQTDTDLAQKFVPSSDSPKSLDEVVGLGRCRKDIKNFIIYPILNPKETEERRKDYGIEIPHFIVFHGPPGCGKTMLAEAIAAETGANMYKIDLSSVESIYVGGTVVNVVNAFNQVKKDAKKSNKPVIVFLDEMDSMLSQRTSSADISQEAKNVVNVLLPVITSAKDSNIIVIGATNMYDTIDKAVKRRIDMNSYIGLPDKSEIETLLKKRLNSIKAGKNLVSNKETMEELSNKFEGYSPANIVNIIKSAARDCFIENKEIKKEDIINALETGTYEKIKEREYIPESMNKRTIGF